MQNMIYKMLNSIYIKSGSRQQHVLINNSQASPLPSQPFVSIQYLQRYI